MPARPVGRRFARLRSISFRSMRSKAAWLIVLLAVLHILILVAGFVAPYDPTTQNRELPYAPPTRLHFVDSAGFHLQPFVYAWMPVDEGYQEDRTKAYP